MREHFDVYVRIYPERLINFELSYLTFLRIFHFFVFWLLNLVLQFLLF